MKKKGLILIVDDDESIRQGLTDVLEEDGYSVVTAENGNIGLQRLFECHPNLIILDISMPVMTGFEFKEVMDSYPTKARIPVVVFTAYPDGIKSKMKNVAEVLDKATPLELILQKIKTYIPTSA